VGLLLFLPDRGAAQVPPSETLASEVVADTYVEESSPNTNFNGDTQLRADADVERITYLRFVVSGVGGRLVEQARLQLEAVAASVTGGTVHLITDTTWDEATVTYATRPAVDGVGLDTLGAVGVGDVVEFNLDGVITGDGIYNLAIDSPSPDGVVYQSSMAPSGHPVLMVTVPAGPEPTVSIIEPPDGATAFVGEPVTFQGEATDSVDGDLSAVIGDDGTE
jgi:hypothetical protein